MTALAFLHKNGLDAETLMGDQVAVWPEQSITPALELWIIEHKAQLVAELRRSGQNPDAVLVDIAQALSADAHMLRALLSDDDMQAIAENCPGYDRARLMDYFRLMEKRGESLYDIDLHLHKLALQGAARSRQGAKQCREQERVWRSTHDSFINHIMACSNCNASRARYCTAGADLRLVYLQAYRKASQSEQSLCPALLESQEVSRHDADRCLP